MTITPSEGKPVRRTVAFGAAVVGAGLGAMVLAMGVPRLIAGLHAAQAGDVLWAVESGTPVDADSLAAAIEALEAADRLEPAAERRVATAFLLTRLAEATEPGPEREALYVRAAATTEAAVAIGPVQPHGWAMLAVLRERAGNPAGAADALRVSMLSGAIEPAIMLWRLNTGLRLLPYMDDDTVALLRRQVRLTWVLSPDRVAALPAEGVAGTLIRRALDDLSEEEIADYLRRHGRR
ncbi:hypothetical protein [Azospirillum halopraeferens]|uniref:hypothetical protein n=1 Tax=Azospirillum halopraeferens TaxID=34010 RepID=UPI0012EBBC3C|nr:hypothetical protein [Azospirillum halopraeferens]